MVLKAEGSESSSATIPSKVPSNIASNIPSCRSLSSAEDGPGGHRSLPAGELARNLQDSVRHRILYLSEQLRVEKASRDENTVGYLKLVSKADRRQAPHIRQAFERVNQRVSATIAQIERRLRRCHQQLQELQEGGRSRGFALKAKSSLDERKQPREKTPFSGPPKPGRADGPSAKLSDLVRHVPLESHFPASRPPKPPETKGAAQRRDLLLQKMKEGLEAARELPCSLQAAYQGLKEKHGADLQASLVSLREEKCRQALLEEQVNEHLQRHLDEIYRLKQSLASAEEKMAYLSYERAKEIWEVMETFKDRISKLETLQRATPVEMMEPFRTHPQKFVFRCASLLLTLATAFLVLVSAVCACPPPLARARLRTCTALALIGLGALAWQKRHALPAADWRAWVPSGWRLYSKDSKPLSDGT